MKKLLVAALLAAGAGSANATVVTFDGLAFQGNGYTLSAGDLIFSNPGHSHYFYYSGYGGVDNGTDYYMAGYDTTTMSRTDGDAFLLNSMDVGRAFSTGSGTFSYLLNLADGGTESGTFNFNGAFQSLTIGRSITSMLFYSANDYIAFDNISYDEAVAEVAEPAMLGLFGLGTLGLGLARRRRRRTA